MSIRLRPLVIAIIAVVLAGPLRAQAQTGFVPEYPPVQGATEGRIRDHFMQDRELERMAQWLNRWIRMPRRVPMRMVECTASDIRWNPEEHALEICYRMVTRLHGLVAGQDSLMRPANGAFLFMTLHGVAHGIIDLLDLQVGADPEPAVDELSALLFVATQEARMPLYLVGGISTLQRADPGWGEWAYATTHRLSQERFRTVACLVYGSAPDYFESLRRAGLVDEGARQRCRTAAIRNAETWTRRLGRYLR